MPRSADDDSSGIRLNGFFLDGRGEVEICGRLRLDRLLIPGQKRWILCLRIGNQKLLAAVFAAPQFALRLSGRSQMLPAYQTADREEILRGNRDWCLHD